MSTQTQSVIKFIRSQALAELQPSESHLSHFVFRRPHYLQKAVTKLKKERWRLVMMWANDERILEDCSFKVYMLFEPDDNIDQFLLLEYALSRQIASDQEMELSERREFHSYPSLASQYPNAELYEREIAEMFGIFPQKEDPVEITRLAASANRLHDSFGQRLFPLRRTRTRSALAERRQIPPSKAFFHPARLPEGQHITPVGPIHAGVIEAGHFHLYTAGEVIEKATIQLGYKHKGIEKLFETSYTLRNGWRLAQRVSGNASFAHSLAYCRGVESVLDIDIPEVAQCWRGLLLEIERIYNHIHDVSGILHDIAMDIIASQMAQAEESIMLLNQRWFENRLLHEINRPGGIVLPSPVAEDPSAALDEMGGILRNSVRTFLALGQKTLGLPACQHRTIGAGILTKNEAWTYGATGIAARASGILSHDVRRQHPRGVYTDKSLHSYLIASLSSENAIFSLDEDDLKGDVYARLALRIVEVEISYHIIQHIVRKLHKKLEQPTHVGNAAIQERLLHTPAFETGLGYAESARGSVYYWIMKGPHDTIARCKVRGPAVANWFAFPHALSRKTITRKDADGPDIATNILADFPLINKSFNLSYAEHDL